MLIKKIKSFFLTDNELSLKIQKNIIGLVLIKGYSIAISFLLIPLTLDILGNYKYGIWITIFNLLSMIQILDIGIGNGLRNMLTNAIANNNLRKAKEYVSTAYIILGIISLGLCVFLILPWNYINWSSIFNSDYLLNNELKKLIGVLFVLTLFSFSLNLINVILSSYHKPAFAAFIMALANTIILIVFFFFKDFLKFNLFLIGLIYSLIPVLVMLVVSILLFSFKYSEIRPSVKFFNKKSIKELVSLGGKFFLIQISILVIFQTDALIISHFLDPSEVTPYSIVYKYFSIITTLITIILTPLWAGYSESYQKKNYSWIKKTLTIQFKYFYLLIFVVIIMLLISRQVINIWVGGNLKITTTLLITTAVFTILNIWNIIIGTFLNGINKIKIQVITNIIGLVINIPLSILLIKFYGVGGVLIATSVSLLFFSIFGGLEVFKTLKSLN